MPFGAPPTCIQLGARVHFCHVCVSENYVATLDSPFRVARWTELERDIAALSGIHATSPLTGSGLLTTADSTTAGCSISALSTSNGPMRYLEEKGSQSSAPPRRNHPGELSPSSTGRCTHPEDMMTSSALPTNQKYPSLSITPLSPVT